MKIKFDHINLTVTNLAESIAWYGKIFGFDVVESGVNSYGAKFGIIANNDSMICMTESSKRKPADQMENESFHQIYHFGIRVPDLIGWRKIVSENNLKLHYCGEVEYPFSRSWYIHDPSGHEIEVNYTSTEQLQFPKRKGAYL